MRIPIKTDIKYFYKVLLTMMSKFPPIRGLMPKEIDVLAEIMLQNYQYKDLPFNKRHLLIFSTENRVTMHKNLNIKFGSFNDYLSRLKRKQVITKDNKLMPFLNIIPGNEYEFTIKFMIDE
jgi:hypothetical protein